MCIMRRVPKTGVVLCKVYNISAIVKQKFYVRNFLKSLQLALLCGKITLGGCTEYAKSVPVTA